jgi:hypothetical protein
MFNRKNKNYPQLNHNNNQNKKKLFYKILHHQSYRYPSAHNFTFQVYHNCFIFHLNNLRLFLYILLLHFYLIWYVFIQLSGMRI